MSYPPLEYKNMIEVHRSYAYNKDSLFVARLLQPTEQRGCTPDQEHEEMGSDVHVAGNQELSSHPRIYWSELLILSMLQLISLNS